jgi:hypothetical protein
VWCDPKDKSVFKEEECRCDSGDQESQGYSAMVGDGLRPAAIEEAKEKKLAAVNWLDYVYNIMLITYKDGKEVCRSTTATGKLLDRDKDGLKGNDVNCRNSPTFVQCKGIKVYYCGKTDYSFGVGDVTRNNYFIEEKDGIHNRAGITAYVHVDPKQYTKPDRAVTRD